MKGAAVDSRQREIERWNRGAGAERSETKKGEIELRGTQAAEEGSLHKGRYGTGRKRPRAMI